MSSQQQQQHPQDKDQSLWLGIDLGTTNSAAACWDVQKGRAKLIRLGDLASDNRDRGWKKSGKIAPSALFFYQDDEENSTKNTTKDVHYSDILKDSTRTNIKAAVCHEAIALDLKNSTRECYHQQQNGEKGALLTSVKRIMGMTESRLKQQASEDEDRILESLPFETVWKSKDDSDGGEKKVFARIWPFAAATSTTDLHDDEHERQNMSDDDDMNDDNDCIDVDPVQASAIILRNIRQAAERYLTTGKIDAPGRVRNNTTSPTTTLNTQTIRNCVIGCPAHYSRSQREALKRACNLAGFDGKVHIIIESTAAAMAYGLNVSVASGTHKNVLVFDMGGGTTDVTIAQCFLSADDEEDKDKHSGFRVLATAGNFKLGGDDIDELIVQWFLEQQEPYSNARLRQLPVHILRRECRAAKEKLCGSGDDNNKSVDSVSIKFLLEDCACKAELTRDAFEDLIAVPLVKKAKDVVEMAISSCRTKLLQDEDGDNSKLGFAIDEVVLVGGGSRVPAIRQMLRERFPPPNPPDLCYSVNADAAVAQGAAIQAAILSGLVPKHEIRSAMMLDALPHAIGILVPSAEADIRGDKTKDTIFDGEFVPILSKDSQLPANGFLTFSLSDVDQKGVTVLAYEDVSESSSQSRQMLQFVGEFNFLLHKLTTDEVAMLSHRQRTIDIGMVCDVNGEFTVSIFDPNDPDHIVKKRKYQRAQQKVSDAIYDEDFDEGDIKDSITTREQVLLMGGLAFVFFLYVTVKLAFNEINEDDGAKIL